MSFRAVACKIGTISTTAAPLSSTVFGFDSTDLSGAQKVTIAPTSASLFINWSTVSPTTVGSGIAVSSGTSYSLTGVVNVAQLKMIAATTSASVVAILEK